MKKTTEFWKNKYEQMKKKLDEAEQKMKEIKDKISDLENEFSGLRGDFQGLVSDRELKVSDQQKEVLEGEKRDQRNNIDQEEYVKLIEIAVQDSDKIKAELNKVKDLLGLNSNDNLPVGWENRLVIKNNLDQDNKKIQEYENDSKIKLESTDSNLPDWKDEIGKVKNLLGLGLEDNLPNDWPSKLAQKDELVAVQNSLRGWTDKFLGKSPNDVEKEISDLNKLMIKEVPQRQQDQSTQLEKVKDENESQEVVDVVDSASINNSSVEDKRRADDDQQEDNQNIQEQQQTQVEQPPKSN